LVAWWTALPDQVARLARVPRLGALRWTTLGLGIGLLIFALGGLIASSFSCHIAKDLGVTQCRTPTAMSIWLHLAFAFIGVGILLVSLRFMRRRSR